LATRDIPPSEDAQETDQAQEAAGPAGTQIHETGRRTPPSDILLNIENFMVHIGFYTE
jgi:hypothetical protein